MSGCGEYPAAAPRLRLWRTHSRPGEERSRISTSRCRPIRPGGIRALTQIDRRGRRREDGVQIAHSRLFELGSGLPALRCDLDLRLHIHRSSCLRPIAVSENSPIERTKAATGKRCMATSRVGSKYAWTGPGQAVERAGIITACTACWTTTPRTPASRCWSSSPGSTNPFEQS